MRTSSLRWSARHAGCGIAAPTIAHACSVFQLLTSSQPSKSPCVSRATTSARPHRSPRGGANRALITSAMTLGKILTGSQDELLKEERQVLSRLRTAMARFDAAPEHQNALER